MATVSPTGDMQLKIKCCEQKSTNNGLKKRDDTYFSYNKIYMYVYRLARVFVNDNNRCLWVSNCTVLYVFLVIVSRQKVLAIRSKLKQKRSEERAGEKSFFCSNLSQFKRTIFFITCHLKVYVYYMRVYDSNRFTLAISCSNGFIFLLENSS